MTHRRMQVGFEDDIDISPELLLEVLCERLQCVEAAWGVRRQLDNYVHVTVRPEVTSNGGAEQAQPPQRPRPFTGPCANEY